MEKQVSRIILSSYQITYSTTLANLLEGLVLMDKTHSQGKRMVPLNHVYLNPNSIRFSVQSEATGVLANPVKGIYNYTLSAEILVLEEMSTFLLMLKVRLSGLTVIKIFSWVTKICLMNSSKKDIYLG